ncbi:MAG TPA: PD-(D/E)XK nuclease family protein, partial [Pyrinomonadaceae bacterium]|nr:PD-(D/E)XK nuclease family protein [Pyrinomonadaceae bacterium]
MNKLLLGPLLGNNRKALIERCAELVANHQNHKFLYIAASRPLLEIITDGILDGAQNRGVWGELPVYLFRGFVRHVLRNAIDENGNGLPPRLPIDRDELPLKRSLISRILSRLKEAGKLKAIAPLAGRDGCVNSIATLVGELQRAAKTPAEVSAIIAARSQDFAQQSGSAVSQIDFDNEVALIYSSYCELLQQYQLTENDADQLRALAVLRGTLDGLKIDVPMLADVELLILDGFFDFTPVQGEILSELIPRIPETLVNLNYDPQNVEIFAPFTETVEQLKAVGTFETFTSDERRETKGVLSLLRGNLFNPSLSDKLQIVGPSNSTSAEELEGSSLQSHDKLKHVGQTSDNLQIVGPSNSTSAEELEGSSLQSHDKLKHVGQDEIRYLECGDRETEIRAIAKEIKRLILVDHYSLSDIALVVRQRDTYSKTITRVMREESVPCKLEWRIDAADVPATRAALKILDLLEQPVEDAPPYRISDLGDLIKSEYFRLSESELDKLNERFDASHLALLSDDNQPLSSDAKTLSKHRHRIGFWDADSLENAFAYVGNELPLGAWLARAQKLIKELPTATATKELLSIDADAQDRDSDIADQVENAETARLDEGVEKKRRPSRDIHPATLAWTALVIQRFSELLFAVPREGTPNELRQGLMRLFDQFGFRDQITRPARSAADEDELPQVMLNFNALESLRRALVAAVKSIEMSDKLQFVGPLNISTAEELESPQDAASPSHDKQKRIGQTSLAILIGEIRRSLVSQSQLLGPADPTGLRVLEATDVRGLQFKALFIAGLVEGGFPLRASRDWIYPHEERDRLRKYGLTLEDISPATLLKEEHYFYQSACRATERLYLTRPVQLEDDSETVASYYIDELRRAIAPRMIEPEVVRRDYDGRAIAAVSNSQELSVSLVRQQERHLHHGEKQKLLPQPRIKRLLTLARNDGFLTETALRRIEIERERAGLHFGPYDGQITDPNLLALLQRKFGPDFVHSASGLSVFGNCAYRFFAQRVLKLEPRGEAALDLQAIDAGKLLHDILRRFFEQHRREALHMKDHPKLRYELLEIADGVFDEHERVVPPLNRQIWKIDREIRKILLEQVLLYELHLQEDSEAKGVVPSFFEIAF